MARALRTCSDATRLDLRRDGFAIYRCGQRTFGTIAMKDGYAGNRPRTAHERVFDGIAARRERLDGATVSRLLFCGCPATIGVPIDLARVFGRHAVGEDARRPI